MIKDAEFDDPPVLLSENIDDSPFKKDKRINEEYEQNFKIPEFAYHENDIKSVQRGAFEYEHKHELS